MFAQESSNMRQLWLKSTKVYLKFPCLATQRESLKKRI